MDKAGLPEKEVMVTLSLMYKGSYMMRHSSIYYIDNPEWWHYAHRSWRSYPILNVRFEDIGRE